MPLVGVTVGRILADGRWRYHCPDDYVRAVAAAGGRACLLPAETILDAGPQLTASFAGFLLSGGGDLAPALFGQAPHAANTSPDQARDRAELSLVQWALAAGRPLLAICRGVQVLNVALGGDLIQDLPAAGFTGHEQAAPRNVKTHIVVPVAGTLLADLLPAEARTNSFHHQAVDRLGTGLAVAGRAADGVIEAVCLPGAPVLGVQWHPEMYADEAPEAAAIFRWLVEQCDPVYPAAPLHNP